MSGEIVPLGRASRPSAASGGRRNDDESPTNIGIRGDYELQLDADGSDVPVFRLAGPVELALATDEPSPGDDGVRLVLDGSGFATITLDVREGEDGWLIAVKPTELELAGEDLVYKATHDRLTGLANRELFRSDLGHALGRADRTDSMVAVFFIDLDHFKRINDTFGHEVGDAVLVEIAQRLSAVSRPMDTVARLGGDEFVVLCEDLEGIRGAGVIGRRLSEVLRRPAVIGDIELAITPSIGVALSRGELSCDEMLRRADAAMYRAKLAGVGSIEVYSEADATALSTRMAEEDRLAEAVARRDFQMYYQPIFALDSNEIVGVESFLRWHRDGELVPAATFMALAVEAGHARELGRWSLERGIEDLVRFRAAGLPVAASLHVNLTAQQVLDRRIVDAATSALRRWQIPGDVVVFEVPEALMGAGLDEAVIEDLQALGVRFAVDGFGTGRSSLAALDELPADLLKIDAEAFCGFGNANRAGSIVAAMISLGHAHDMRVIAAGVSREGDLDRLSLLSCDAAQGDALASPMTADQLVRMLDGTRSRTRVS